MQLEELERQFQEKAEAEARRMEGIAHLRYTGEKKHDWRLCNDFCRAAGYCTGNGSAFCAAEMDQWE